MALEEIVPHHKVMKDIATLSEFCHTEGLEVYHSMLLKYCPKREHFSYEGIKLGSQLAAIDNNENVGRMQAVVKRGANTGKARYRKCYSQKQKQWVVKAILEKNHFIPEMQERVREKCESDTAVPLELDIHLPQNIATEAAPDKHEAFGGTVQDLTDKQHFLSKNVYSCKATNKFLHVDTWMDVYEIPLSGQ